jgi:hypothetical protein
MILNANHEIKNNRMNTAYFDMRDLDWRGGCPVRGCSASLGMATYRRKQMPYCPVHCIRIHNSKTFVYYNGTCLDSRRTAALRNIIFERDYFASHILGNAAKAESHRICHETSEDALTWNVFSSLVREDLLRSLVSGITGCRLAKEPELYLWGLRVSLDDSSVRRQFPTLEKARTVFEPDIKNWRTEPDIMMHVPGELLILVEAKFTSGNTIATENPHGDKTDEKPKSRKGILKRYKSAKLPQGVLIPAAAVSPFYSQLYRNLVFAIYMAEQLGVKWAVANLVSERLFSQKRGAAYDDPTGFIHSVLSENHHEQFIRYSWERLYGEYVQNVPRLSHLASYMRYKSAYCSKAFEI